MCGFFSFFSEEVDQLARNLGCRLIRTSVKEDVNVSSVFRYLATKCHQIMMQQYNVVPVGQPQISMIVSSIQTHFSIDFVSIHSS